LRRIPIEPSTAAVKFYDDDSASTYG
jgi:hypothetical protein